MTISLDQFKTNTLGRSLGNPGTNTYVGQCVSYARQYMEQVLGIPTKAWGNAVDYYSNPDVLRYFDKVTDRRDGDVLVWGDDAGNWTNVYGHIGIAYGGKILNQNYGGSLKVSINDFFTPGYLGALRPKGATTKVDEEARKWIAGLTTTVEGLAATVKQQGLYIEGLTRTVTALADDLKKQGSNPSLNLDDLRIVKK